MLTTTDSNMWGGASGHTYSVTRHPKCTTDIDVDVVREGKTTVCVAMMSDVTQVALIQNLVATEVVTDCLYGDFLAKKCATKPTRRSKVLCYEREGNKTLFNRTGCDEDPGSCELRCQERTAFVCNSDHH